MHTVIGTSVRARAYLPCVATHVDREDLSTISARKPAPRLARMRSVVLAPSQPMGRPVELDGIELTLSAIQALRGASFSAGTVQRTAISGLTSVINATSGYPPDVSRVVRDGKVVTRLPIHARAGSHPALTSHDNALSRLDEPVVEVNPRRRRTAPLQYRRAS